jgi:tetratricopeptide (TPR) repeat protein
MKETVIIFLIFIEFACFSQVSIQTEIKCGTQSKRAQEFFDAGNAGLGLNKLIEAKKLFYAATREDSLFCDAWDHMSICCRRLGHYKDAFTAGINSLVIDSTNAVAWTNCGYAAYLDGEIENALISFEHLKRILPENPEGYYGMSMVLYSINELGDALDNIILAKEKYLTNNIHYGQEVDLLHGFIEYKFGNLMEAQKLFQKVYIKFKNNAELNYYLSECILVNENNIKKSNKYKNKAIMLGYNPENTFEPLN